ncbi:hypothetical protein Tco_1427229, partial [Tanacetum coccineum]
MNNNINHFKLICDQGWKKHVVDEFCAPTAKDMIVLVETCLMPLAIKRQNDSFKFIHELKQEMFADLQYIQSVKKEIDELKFDEADFLSIYDLLLQECVSKDVMCSYLHSLFDFDTYTELQCLYHHKIEECECLAEKLSKQTKTLQEKNIPISELKKLIKNMKGKSVDTNFEKQSILGKPPLRNQLLVRQPTAYKFERSQAEKHRFASQVDVSNNLTKTVTPHSWPQVRKSSFAKPYDVNAPSPARKILNHVSFQSPKESVGSNDTVHNYYLEEAKNKAKLQQDK